MSSTDFRMSRVLLPPEAFAIAEGSDDELTDLVHVKDWSGITFLPDDVSLRTSAHHGTMLGHAYESWGQWIGIVLDTQGLTADGANDVLAVATANATDEFQASIYFALTGFYRQSIGTLRAVLEAMLAAAYLKKRTDPSANAAWMNGEFEGRVIVGQYRRKLAETDPYSRFELEDHSLFGDKGWFAWLYEMLSAFLHGRPTLATTGGIMLETTNAGMWQSNGPLYKARAFEFWAMLFFDSMLLAALLAGLSDEALVKVAHPSGISFESFVEHVMELHPDPGAPQIAAVIASHLMP
jgi:hypothetical protein